MLSLSAGSASRFANSALPPAIAHDGMAVIDVISPCVTFNDHEGSTKSYAYTREHNVEIVQAGRGTGWVATRLAQLQADCESGEVRIPVAWRNVPSQPQRSRFAARSGVTSSEDVTVEWYGGRTGYRSATRDDVHVVDAGPESVTLTELSDAEVALAAHPSDVTPRRPPGHNPPASAWRPPSPVIPPRGQEDDPDPAGSGASALHGREARPEHGT